MKKTDVFSLTAMFVLVVLCLIAGILPGYFIDVLAAVTQQLLGAQLPRQAHQRWLTIVPIAKARSSYNGLLLHSHCDCGVAGGVFHPRWASTATRRSAAWDCGFPDASPITQYTAGSFAQPIRRVFGSVAFRAREEVHMPSPGQRDPRASKCICGTSCGIRLCAGRNVVSFAADRLNTVQSWTIRAYLTLVFGAVVMLLMVLAVWN